MKKLAFLLGGVLMAMNMSCANKVTRGAVAGRELLFQFSVRGTLALNNPNVTYYLALNAPNDRAKVDLNETTEGPRINGPNTSLTNTDLAGRLPFTGLQLGDIRSQWTHFFYIQGNTTGSPQVGYGQNNDTQENPLGNIQASITQSNYPATFWSQLSPSTFQLRIPLSELGLNDDNMPNNIPANLAVSQNLTDNSGFGLVYDHWLNNVPFSIITTPNNSPLTQEDNTPNIVLGTVILPNRPVINTPPTGVDIAALDLISYEYRVLIP